MTRTVFGMFLFLGIYFWLFVSYFETISELFSEAYQVFSILYHVRLLKEMYYERNNFVKIWFDSLIRLFSAVFWYHWIGPFVLKFRTLDIFISQVSKWLDRPVEYIFLFYEKDRILRWYLEIYYERSLKMYRSYSINYWNTIFTVQYIELPRNIFPITMIWS